jgi:hypothetical protein
MATVQLVAVRSGVATVQKDNEAPVEMTWGLLHDAQQQDGATGYVYRWLMHEFCRCEYDQRQGKPWQSPRREVEEIVADLRAQDARAAAEAEAARMERQERQAAEDRRRRRDEEVRRVEAERRQTADDDPWWPIPWWEVPVGVRFDTPGRNQGQIVEVSFGTFGRAEAGSIDPYMNVTDHSDGSSRTYKRRSI